ncbi:MAG: anthranilate phosphoribosyltransferase, partial [Chthoniobacterales bacterium]
MNTWEQTARSGELTAGQIREVATWLLDENVAPDEKADFLGALHRRGETPAEVVTLAETMLEHAVPFDVPDDLRPVIDVCGTGGDKLGLFNISTAVMFVAAGAGARLVKHGNRGITSKSGGADVLEALGLPVDLPVERLQDMLGEAGAVFLFAPCFHPAFKAVAPARKLLAERGQPSVFNMLGPLLNPSRPEGQLAGVFNESLVDLYADVLPGLGRERAWVVHGKAGDTGVMDEISTLGPTLIAKVSGEKTTRDTVTPADLGVPAAALEALRGGDAPANAQLLSELLRGERRGATRDIVAVNAAAALIVAGLTDDWAEARERAEESIDS